MRRWLALLGTATTLLVVVTSSSAQKGAAPHPRLVEGGAQLFQQYCVSCHGADAKGDGIVAPVLVQAPPDLTAIAARRGGRFPDAEIAGWIDGRFEIAAHGSREMPIWGVKLRNELPPSGLEEEIVRGQIDMLVAYLQSIQGPTPVKAIQEP